LLPLRAVGGVPGARMNEELRPVSPDSCSVHSGADSPDIRHFFVRELDKQGEWSQTSMVTNSVTVRRRGAKRIYVQI